MSPQYVTRVAPRQNGGNYHDGMAASLSRAGTWRRREQVSDHQPRQGRFPRHRRCTKLDLIALLPGCGRRCAARRGGPADDPQAIRQGHHRGGRLPEARARKKRPDYVDVAELQVRVRNVGQGGCDPRRRRPGRGQSTWAASTSTRIRCRPTTSPIPTSCGSTSIRCREWTGSRSSTSRSSPARCSRTTA